MSQLDVGSNRWIQKRCSNTNEKPCSICGATSRNGRLEWRLLLQPQVEFRSTDS
jgi:hypothetical protein